MEKGDEIVRKAREVPKLIRVTKGKRSIEGIFESDIDPGIGSRICGCLGPFRPSSFVLAMVAVTSKLFWVGLDLCLGSRGGCKVRLGLMFVKRMGQKRVLLFVYDVGAKLSKCGPSLTPYWA